MCKKKYDIRKEPRERERKTMLFSSVSREILGGELVTAHSFLGSMTTISFAEGDSTMDWRVGRGEKPLLSGQEIPVLQMEEC